jgi:hypothetical protein
MRASLLRADGPNRGQTRVVQRNVPQESFFNFFSPPQGNPESNEEEEDDENNNADVEGDMAEDYMVCMLGGGRACAAIP